MSLSYIQLVYNADGEMLIPIVIHDGSMSDALCEHYGGKVGFIETDDGQMNYETLGGCLQHIYEYVNVNKRQSLK